LSSVESLKIILKQALLNKVTPCIWGKHGIGKTAIVNYVGDFLGFDVIDLRLGQMEVGDLLGIPDKEYFCEVCGKSYGSNNSFSVCPVCKERGETNYIIAKTSWCPPSWLRTSVKQKKRLYFFDEINRARGDVRQAAFQIVYDYRIHTHKFFPDDAVVCACNPVNNEINYDVDDLDEALLSRFLNLKFTLDTKDWISWAKGNIRKPEIINFIRDQPKMLGNSSIDIPLNIKPNPRAYEMLDKCLNDAPRELYAEIATALIGEAAAISLMTSWDSYMDKPISSKDIFNNLSKVKPDILRFSSIENGVARLDLLRETLDDTISVLKGEEKLTDKQLNSWGDFLLLIPKDLSFSGIKEVLPLKDYNSRLLLKRPDLFKLVVESREAGK
jgi:hypothetical protein